VAGVPEPERNKPANLQEKQGEGERVSGKGGREGTYDPTEQRRSGGGRGWGPVL